MKSKRIFTIFLIILIMLISMPSYADTLIESQNIKIAQSDNINLYSEAAILIEANTGKILYEKNSNNKMYPASTTKIMTAILAIENCDLDETVTVNYNAIKTIPSGYSTADLKADEELTVKQLLEVLLVHSANDAANVLAMHVGGSIESFVSMMNSKAQELGCINTNFTNSYGLHEESHYTTAYDLSLIAKYCMQNSTFRSFVSQPSCTITATNKHESRRFVTTNDLLRSSSRYYYEDCIGIKTGYTKEAKNCLIAAANQNGFEVISVVLGADLTSDNLSARYVDTTSMFDYAYNNYTMKKLANKDDVITQATISNGTKETKNLDVIISKDIEALIGISDNENSITPTIKLDGNLSAPIAEGTIVGTVSYTVGDTQYEANLVASHDVEKSDFLIITFMIIIIIVILFTLYKLLFNKNNKKRRKQSNYLFR